MKERTINEVALVANLAKLPDMCYVEDVVKGTFVAVKKGQTGFFESTVFDWRHADLLNKRMGVTTAQYWAMLHGSVFGFDLPIADPDLWQGENEPWLTHRMQEA